MQEIKVEELKIDEELRDLLPPLSKDEFEGLEKLIISDSKLFSPIFIWQGYIVDGHNRYKICKKHNIDFSKNVVSLGYETKDDVKKWMLDTQLGRRNLTPIQRVAIAEKYRDLYEKKARENQKTSTGGSKPQLVQISSQAEKIKVRDELAKIAKVSHDTYSKANKILKSNNNKLKQEVGSGEKSINAAYNELTGKNKKNEKSKEIKEETVSNDVVVSQPKETIKQDKSEVPIKPQTQTKICSKCKQEKSIDKFPHGYDLCDECQKNPYKPIERDYAAEVKGEGEVWDIIRDLKTPKIVADCVTAKDVTFTINNFQEDFTDHVEELEDKLFTTYQLHRIISQEDKDRLIGVLNVSMGKLLKLTNKVKNIEIKGE